MSKSIELTVKVNPVWVEYVSDVLIEKIGCSGVVTDEKYYDDEVLTRESNGIVKGYKPFIENMPVNPKLIQDILLQEREKLISSGIEEQNLGEWTLSLAEISDDEWAHSWKKYWHPQKISEKVVICPSWEEYKTVDEEIIINLDPGSAFGTGTHPTTRLCVQALEKVIPEYNSIKIADIGTGSGILAVVGVKLGADFAVGVDNDASVISVAIENAEKNNAANKCKFYTGIASDVEGEYEIVVANILAHILIEAMPELTPLVKHDGKLILSGIILEKSQDVQISCIQNGLKIVEVLQEDSWVAIIAGK
jgi:ribosomal protein L11 methyltransferase